MALRKRLELRAVWPEIFMMSRSGSSSKNYLKSWVSLCGSPMMKRTFGEYLFFFSDEIKLKIDFGSGYFPINSA